MKGVLTRIPQAARIVRKIRERQVENLSPYPSDWPKWVGPARWLDYNQAQLALVRALIASRDYQGSQELTEDLELLTRLLVGDYDPWTKRLVITRYALYPYLQAALGLPAPDYTKTTPKEAVESLEAGSVYVLPAALARGWYIETAVKDYPRYQVYFFGPASESEKAQAVSRERPQY